MNKTLVLECVNFHAWVMSHYYVPQSETNTPQHWTTDRRIDPKAGSKSDEKGPSG